MQPDYFIELAGEEDLPAIAAINVAAFQPFALHMAPEHWASMRSNISMDRLVSLIDSVQFFVCRHMGNVVGSVAYCPPGSSRPPISIEWASMLLLAVDPSHQKHHVGSLLVQTCMAQAKTDRAPSVGLYTSELMTAAHRLYEKAGFQQLREIPPRNGLRYFLYEFQAHPLPSTEQQGVS